MSKRIASKAKAKRALRKGHHSGYKLATSSKNKGNAKKGTWDTKAENAKWKNFSTAEDAGYVLYNGTMYRLTHVGKKALDNDLKVRRLRAFKAGHINKV